MLGEANLLAGDVEAAARRAAEALDLSRRYGQRGWEAWALRLQGDVAAARGNANEATTRFHDAIALADPRGMRPLLAHCRSGLGQVHALRGNRGAARDAITAALAEYRAMAMPYWIVRAEAALSYTSQPPSTVTDWPVMFFESSEERNATALAMSSATVTRRSAISCTYSS